MKSLSSHCLILVLILSYQCSPNQLKEHCNLLVDNDNETLSTLKKQLSEQLLCRCVSAQYNVLYLVCKEHSLILAIENEHVVQYFAKNVA